jgi:hypothetical protein
LSGPGSCSSEAVVLRPGAAEWQAPWLQRSRAHMALSTPQCAAHSSQPAADSLGPAPGLSLLRTSSPAGPPFTGAPPAAHDVHAPQHTLI